MSFGGFIGGGSGNRSGGGAKMVADSLYDAIPSSAIAEPHMITQPIARSMFNYPPLSLAIKPKMEGVGEMAMMGENFGLGGMEKAKEEEYESRSGSDNIEGASGDDPDTPGDKSSRRKKYHRHTPYQIQELEAYFKENPHPDEKARLELGSKLGLESKQVKFWFQNRRTQMKTQMERHENSILKQENDKLRVENIAMKEAMRNPICNNCGGPAALGEISVEEHHLRIENARLRDELNRVCLLANRFLGRPLSSLGGSMAPENSDLELAVGRSGLSSVGLGFPIGLDFGSVVASTLPVLPATRSSIGMTSVDMSSDKSMFLELALAAMDELLKLAQIDNPLWYRSWGGCEALDLEEYTRSFPPCIGMKPRNFVTEATRATGTILLNSLALIEILMDPNEWAEMFPCIIGRSSIIDLISCGVGGTRNGALQLMHAEIQVLSSMVPVRQVKFLRFCKQHAEGVWALVDISVDDTQQGPNAQGFADCRRLPSGCIVQDMPNGYSKIIWVEHMEYDESNVHQIFRPLLRSGMGFGAQRWVATLKRQCEFMAFMSSTVPAGDHTVIGPSGRRSISKLAQRMTRNFCAGVCATLHKWENVQIGNSEDVRLMMRKSIGNPGEPPGVILSATTTVWLPVSQQRLFDFLQNEHTRSQWDVLSQDGPVQKMFHIAKGQDLGNGISLLRATATGGNANQSGMLILQETSTDVSGSLIVHAAVDIPAMNVVVSGGDSSCVVLLPSGFAIVPDCYANSNGPGGSSGVLAKEGSDVSSVNGSLLTVGFQILVNNLPAAKLTVESVDTVNTLVSRTLQGIRSALQCN